MRRALWSDGIINNIQYSTVQGYLLSSRSSWSREQLHCLKDFWWEVQADKNIALHRLNTVLQAGAVVADEAAFRRGTDDDYARHTLRRPGSGGRDLSKVQGIKRVAPVAARLITDAAFLLPRVRNLIGQTLAALPGKN